MPKFSSKERERIYKTLLEKGKEMFNEKGFYEVTAEAVALEAGIAKGTFYHFFENKEHLYMVINNRTQEEIFENIRKILSNLENEGQVDRFFHALCYAARQFMENPLMMEIDARVWQRIEEKAPKACVEENSIRDLKLFETIENSGIQFRYDLHQTMRIIQLQFLQLPYIKEAQDVENMKIILRALSEHLIME